MEVAVAVGVFYVLYRTYAKTWDNGRHPIDMHSAQNLTEGVPARYRNVIEMGGSNREIRHLMTNFGTNRGIDV